ncbi:MAG: TolC family protein [Candidatus Marinimicrobia bacterium]|nr:TolC family protein [Candidatus Neomarinimicrobiota bacterium]
MKLSRQLGLFITLGGGWLTAQGMPGLTLEQLIDLGLDNSSGIRIAQRNLSAAKADRRGSYSGLAPSLRLTYQQDLDPGQAFIDPLTGSNVEPQPFGNQLILSQTLFDGAAAWYRAASGANAQASAEWTLTEARQQGVLAIKQAYYNYLSRLKLLGVSEEALALSRKQLELVEERYRLQAVKQTDLLKARVSTGQRAADLHRAMQALATARTSVNVTLGQEPSRALNLVQESVSLEPLPDREAALTLLLRDNPTLERSRLAVESSWLSAKQQRGLLLPSLSVSYTLNASSAVAGEVFTFPQDIRSTAARLSVSLPLFTGLRNSSQYSRLRYLALAEEERLEAQERELKRQLENTFSSLKSLHNIYPINQEVLASAEADVRLAEVQYNLGAISILNLLDAQVSLITARSTLVRTTYDIKIAEAQLQALMGVSHR